MRERGAIAWKVLVAVAATGGGVWVATLLSSQQQSRERAAVVAGETAPTRLAQTDQPGGAPSASAPATPQNDPFAGVDVSSNSVLRHIAGIEEKARVKLAAAKRTAPAPAEGTNPERIAAPAATRAEASDETRTRPAPAAVPASSASTTPGLAETARPAVAPAQSQPAVAAPADNPLPAPLKSPATAPVNTAPSIAVDRTLAAARPEPPAPVVAPPLRIVNRTMPEFPGEAIRAGVRSGRVVARLTIDADGRVTGTQLLSATPSGFFERESRRALSTWRYEPPGREATTDVELVFNRE